MIEFSYCETIAAYKWHIRQLTDKGRKLGGGADTNALCGAPVKWDVNHASPRVDDLIHAAKPSFGFMGRLCSKCEAVFKEQPIYQ